MKHTNKDGSLTAYALACGYIQQKDVLLGVEAKLHEQHGCYFTTIYDFNSNKQYIYFASHSLTEAKEVYNNATWLFRFKNGVQL